MNTVGTEPSDASGTGAKPLSVLIVDDSAMARLLVRRSLEQFSNVRILGHAKDGVEAVEMIRRLGPDLVTLDIEMPNKNGLQVLSELREHPPQQECRIVVVSRLTAKGAKITTEAVLAGAFDAIEKPAQPTFEENLRAMTLELDRSIRAAGIAREVVPVAATVIGGPSANPRRPPANHAATKVQGIVIAISTGGPAALRQILPQIPAEFPVPIFIVQHMPAGFVLPLVERLNELSSANVVLAREGQFIGPGTIAVAPAGVHLEVESVAQGGALVRLSDAAPEHNCRPAADVLFRSAVQAWGAGTLGLVMTGMGRDGLAGSRAIRDAGGRVIAQSPSGCTVYGMPKAVIESGLADACEPLEGIVARMIRLVGNRPADGECSASG